jgi:hypothetical protein
MFVLKSVEGGVDRAYSGSDIAADVALTFIRPAR